MSIVETFLVFCWMFLSVLSKDKKVCSVYSMLFADGGIRV